MKAKKVAILLVLTVSLTLLGGCDESETVESTPIEASGTESAESDTVPGSDVTLPDDVITAETPTSGESADPDDTQGGDDAQEAGESEHTHIWTTETRYRTETTTVHHDAEYKTVEHPAEYRTEHHDAVYTTVHHPEETTYTTEYIDGHTCMDCGAFFTDLGAALAHQDSCMHNSGLVDDRMPTQVAHTNPAWDEQVLVSAAWDEQVLVKEAWTEQVLVKDAWDETVTTQVPYTVTVCSECGKEKE